ncbi:MAG: hypothetical protein KGK06_09055 [Xanthomonadaceae bacterium]|nr:hypothetical protein [Xanthomonadaceae bacterium]MDE2278161.1 hypothetical protein [Xanthomonadaceae bacterium]MDE2316537.1 hypothetical protein [Xanthomonadaceae bacterium]
MSNPILGDSLAPVERVPPTALFAGDSLQNGKWPGQDQRRSGRITRISRRSRGIALLLTLFVFNGVARSADISLLVGDSVTSHRRTTPAAAADWLGKSWQWGGIKIQPDVGLTYVSARSHQGNDFDRDSWVGAAGVRFPTLWHHLFFSFQLGAAARQTPALSSTQQFISSLGWRQHGLAILVRHISNGSTRKPNLGETMLLAGVDLKLR